MALPRRSLLLALLACVAAGAFAARMPGDLHIMEAELSESLVSLSGASSAVHAADEANSGAPVTLEGGYTVGSSSYAADLEALAYHPEVSQAQQVAGAADNKGKKGWAIRIAVKHLVKPDAHGGFVRQFWRLQEKSRDIKGLRYLSLSKVAGDNIVWTSYAVYEDFHALIKHARSEGVRDFGSYLTTANIPVSVKLLFRIAGGWHGHKSSSAAVEAAAPAAVATESGAAAATGVDKKRHDWPIRLLTAYIVRPDEHRSFIKAWEKLEKSIGGSEGNIALSLSKPAGDNLVFVSYSAWESWADLRDAAESKATRKFIEYIRDSDITEITKRLFKVPTPHW